MSHTKHVISALAALSLAVGCAHANTNTPPQTVAEQKNNDASTQQKAQMVGTAEKPADATPQEDTAHQALEKAIADMGNVKVFFNFDDATLTDEGKASLARIGDILSKNPRLSIRIEGNCDERGTEAYNLALGQRRADTAKQYLVALGSQDGQIATISYGAEKPAAQGHDETAWRQNRRDEFIVTTAAK